MYMCTAFRDILINQLQSASADYPDYRPFADYRYWPIS